MCALIGIVSAKNNIKDTLVVALGMWLVGSAVVIMSVFRPTWEAFWQYIWYLTGVMTLCFIIREIIQYYRQARKSTASIGI